MDNHKQFMQAAIDLAKRGMNSNLGSPLGALVEKDNKIIGEGFNQVTPKNHPTAQSEKLPLEKCRKKLQSFQFNK